MPFIKQLQRMKIDPKEYLRIAKSNAKRNGLNPDELEFSTKSTKKLMYENIHFGSYGYNDYIIYTLLNDTKKDIYRDRYQKSHMELKGDWRKNKLSPNNLSLNINW